MSNHTDHGHRKPNPKDRLLGDLDLILEEQIALTIARHYFRSFCAPESEAWIRAIEEAETRFGPVEGPCVASRVLSVLKTIRRARRSTFLFNNPCCIRCAAVATEHERRLVSSLASIRRGNMGRARMEVIMLCEGNGVDQVLAALCDLSETLAGQQQAAVSDGQSKELRALRGTL
ncbi:MAG: hypothetical protein AAGG56_03065 [Pseudomonadota bacterium]